MARLLLMDIEEMEVSAVVITLYTIVDEKDQEVCGANSLAEANAKAAKLRVQYPDHRFYVVN